MTTTERIREWFISCPTVYEIVGFNTDYIGDDTNECAIYSMPSNLSYTEDVLGNLSFQGKQTLDFLFALKAPYGDDVRQNLDNLKFFNEVKEWMFKQNAIKNFPKIQEGDVKSILPTQTEFLSDVTSNTALYQMQCTLTYWRDN